MLSDPPIESTPAAPVETEPGPAHAAARDANSWPAGTAEAQGLQGTPLQLGLRSPRPPAGESSRPALPRDSPRRWSASPRDAPEPMVQARPQSMAQREAQHWTDSEVMAVLQRNDRDSDPAGMYIQM